jgi:hypothetical protein
MDDASTKLKTLLNAGGIEHAPFMATLAKNKITPVMFMDRLQAVARETEVMQPQNALALRALHLESGNPVKIFNMLGHAATLQDKSAKGLKKVGALISSIGNVRNFVKHYTGSGFGALVKNGSRLGGAFITNTTKSEKGFAWPKFKVGDPNPEIFGERVLEATQNILKNFKPGQNKGATQHLAAFLDLTPQSVSGIVEGAQNILKSPQWRTHIKAVLREKSTAGKTQLGTSEVYVALNEVLGAVGKFHNPVDTKRMADAISIFTAHGKDTKPLELLSQYWEAGKKPLVQIAEEAPKLAEVVANATEVVHQKITFANRPSVNLGAAVLALGGAVLVGNQFAKSHNERKESTSEDGSKIIETKTIPAGFWAKTAQFIGVSTLLAACGVSGVRAATMPNKHGISFVEKMLAGGSAASSRV